MTDPQSGRSGVPPDDPAEDILADLIGTHHETFCVVLSKGVRNLQGWVSVQSAFQDVWCSDETIDFAIYQTLETLFERFIPLLTGL